MRESKFLLLVVWRNGATVADVAGSWTDAVSRVIAYRSKQDVEVRVIPLQSVIDLPYRHVILHEVQFEEVDPREGGDDED